MTEYEIAERNESYPAFKTGGHTHGRATPKTAHAHRGSRESKDYPKKGIGLVVKLAEAVTSDQLEKLARRIRRRRAGDYESVLLTYYLEGMDLDSTPAWARTHFAPRLDIDIMGLTKEQIERLRRKAPEKGNRKVGTWLDRRQGGGLIVIESLAAEQRPPGYHFAKTFADGSRLEFGLRAKQASNPTRFEKVNGTSEFALAADGTLEIYEKNELSRRIRPLRVPSPP